MDGFDNVKEGKESGLSAGRKRKRKRKKMSFPNAWLGTKGSSGEMVRLILHPSLSQDKGELPGDNHLSSFLPAEVSSWISVST
jgi:hypothetical protein